MYSILSEADLFFRIPDLSFVLFCIDNLILEKISFLHSLLEFFFLVLLLWKRRYEIFEREDMKISDPKRNWHYRSPRQPSCLPWRDLFLTIPNLFFVLFCIDNLIIEMYPTVRNGKKILFTLFTGVFCNLLLALSLSSTTKLFTFTWSLFYHFSSSFT